MELKAENINKTYKGRQVVKGVSLEVNDCCEVVQVPALIVLNPTLYLSAKNFPPLVPVKDVPLCATFRAPFTLMRLLLRLLVILAVQVPSDAIVIASLVALLCLMLSTFNVLIMLTPSN